MLTHRNGRRRSRLALLPILVATLLATGCGRFGGVSVRGPGFNVQVPPLGYSYGSTTPYYGSTPYADPRYAYPGQVPPNGEYVDPRQYNPAQYNPAGQYADPSQYYAAQQQPPPYYGQTPYAYNAAAPANTGANAAAVPGAGAQPTGGVPGAGLVASPFAPASTQPLTGSVPAQFG